MSIKDVDLYLSRYGILILVDVVDSEKWKNCFSKLLEIKNNIILE